MAELGAWNGFLGRKVHLIACGGTALTLGGIKESTKDVDFMVPDEAEYKYLIRILKDLGYRQNTASGWQKEGSPFIYDLFRGKRIHTTELLESPLKEGGHRPVEEYSKLYIGILNDYDLIVSKLFRGTRVDFEDCLMLVKARGHKIDIDHLQRHFKELAGYDISEGRILKNLDDFIKLLRKEGRYGE